MRISVLRKELASNCAINHCISELWEIHDYRKKMCEYRSLPTEEEFMQDMINIYSRNYNGMDNLDYNETRIMKRMLRKWNPDTEVWAKYGFPREVIDKDNKIRADRIERAKRKESLDFLYEQLGIERDSKPDIVAYIAINIDLFNAIMAEKNRNGEISIDAFYNICEQVLIPKIKSKGEKLFYNYKIMCFASKKKHNKKSYWEEENGIDFKRAFMN